MSYALMVAAVVAGFGLTAFCAAIFHIRSFWVLFALVVAFSFGVPALISVLTAPAGTRFIPWEMLAWSLGLAAAIAAVVFVSRVFLRRLPRRTPRGGPDASPRDAGA